MPDPETPDVIAFSRLTFGSLSRIGLICNACLWLPAGLLLGILSLLGGAAATFNGTPVTGVSGLLTGLFIGVSGALGGTLAMVAGAALSRWAAPLLRGQSLRVRAADAPH